MVESVPGVGAENERNFLRQLERLEDRQILLDELRSKHGVDRIVSEGVRGREQERAANAAYEPLGPVPLRTSIGTAASQVRPVIGTLVGLDS
jgi:hypothetical protein